MNRIKLNTAVSIKDSTKYDYWIRSANRNYSNYVGLISFLDRIKLGILDYLNAYNSSYVSFRSVCRIQKTKATEMISSFKFINA